MPSLDSFKTRTSLTVGADTVSIFSLPALENEFPGVARLPYSLKILLENLLRREDNAFVKTADIRALASWDPKTIGQTEMSFMPARVLLQDFTGVPCVVDLAAMRDGIVALGGDPQKVNPLQPVELVIDHSVQVDHFGTANALALNGDLEYHRNRERYVFLRWGQTAFRNFRVVPPETGIVHQVNIEYLARVVCREDADGGAIAYPDTVFGTDSHTTMVNGLGVVGWGVGGIEAEAAMLGQPSSMLIPPVLGYRLTGRLPEGATATDLVLTITEAIRKKGVVGKFVEFFGPGLAHLTIADRVTLGNMCPEYGSTVAIFPIDDMTLDYLRLTGRDAKQIALVEAYAKAQGLFRTADSPDAAYSETMELDLGSVEPSLAGPRRPQDRVSLSKAKPSFAGALDELKKGVKVQASGGGAAVATATQLEHGSVVIAAITSCTNTSNPSVMIGAGLVAKKAVEKGLTRKPWVKTSLAPGSKVVTDYLKKSGLDAYLDRLGFNLVGYGCTTCIGNSGPLPDEISAEINERGLVVASVSERQSQFRGPHPAGRARELPRLAAAGRRLRACRIDEHRHHEGAARHRHGWQAGVPERRLADREGNPADDAAQRDVRSVPPAVCERVRRRRALAEAAGADRRPFQWEGASTYVRKPPFLEGLSMTPPPPADLRDARALAVLGDSITTDHISPAGSIKANSPAGKYLIVARRRAEGLQFLWRAARQSRSDDARHFRQHAHQEPDGARHRRRRDRLPARRRSDADLRRGDEVPGGRRAAGRHRRQGIRIRIVARLGGEGHHAARREGRDRRELRAHPSQQSRQHGRAAAAVQGRRECGDARPDRPRSVLVQRRRRGVEAARRSDGDGPGRRRFDEDVHGRHPHRHARGAGRVLARRHPAVRAAPARQEITVT